MPATTIKLPTELKQRIAALIEGTGQSMHSFLLQAVEEQARLAERRRRVVDDALAARATSLRTGKGYAAEQVHAFVRAMVGGRKANRPRAKSWRG